MYYQGQVRPVYYQGKRVENICSDCANNQYWAYGDEHQCTICKEYQFFKKRKGHDEVRIKIFNWLNKKGIYARPKANYPFIEVDWGRMGNKPRP